MTASYSGWLVALSIVVAMLASYTALDVAARVTENRGRAARLWLIGGAFAMGAGIWSMHFIGMLAFSLPVPTAHDPLITLASLLIAMLLSGFALAVVSRPRMTTRDLLLGGVVMGAGICAMHYTGMAAMRMSPPIQYDPLLFAASVAIAMGASVAALWLAFTLRTAATLWAQLAKVLAAVVMGFAITGMHYTGMAAANFAPGGFCLAAGPGALAGPTLAVAIGAAFFFILTITLTASRFDARLTRATARMLESLREKNGELEAEVEQRKAVEIQLQARSVALEASNRALEQFAAVASHDLQAPLRSVAGFVQLLQRHLGNALDDQSREYIQQVVDAATHMHQMIKALLEISRVGEQGVHREYVDLNEVVAEVRELLDDAIIQRGVGITATNLPTLVGDRVLLRQVLLNLVSNAIKFQRGRATDVVIAAKRGENEWQLSVIDHGIGIDSEHFTKIFRMFQRLNADAAFSGTGIGLATCDKIVRLHGGRIWVESVVGQGSAFFFTIPNAAPARAQQPAPKLEQAA